MNNIITEVYDGKKKNAVDESVNNQFNHRLIDMSNF